MKTSTALKIVVTDQIPIPSEKMAIAISSPPRRRERTLCRSSCHILVMPAPARGKGVW